MQKTLSFSSIVPDMVNRVRSHRLDIAGKGINNTRVLTQLGKKAVYLTQLGGHLRPLFLSLCEADFINVEWVESSSPIRFCYTLINDADSSLTELVEESETVQAGTEERLLEKFDSLLRGETSFKYLIVSGSKAAGFSDKIIPIMVRRAKEKDLKVILDIRGKDLTESLQYGPDIIKPNLSEFVSTFAPDLMKNNLTEDTAGTKTKIQTVMLDISKRFGCNIILTRGREAVWAVEKEIFFETDVQTVETVNTTGSGDAFTAGLACALEDGAGFREAIAEGIRCGALNAGFIRPGVIR
ncbi:MAG: PfkB family carbohydrate kinase [Treponema sp.]|nr:PfkB family carbohydrate kinase [Treponema sp.]